MKLAKKTVGYAVAFTAGTLLSGSAAFAATTYVQAQKANTSVQYHGATVSNPPGLVYGGSMYVQLYSIQQGLKQAGFTTGWNGSTFALNENSTAKLSGGTSDNNTVWTDLEYTQVRVQSGALDFITAADDAKATPQTINAAADRLIGVLNDSVAALQKDTPSDATLTNGQTEFISSLKELSTAYSEAKTAIATNNDADMQKFTTDNAQAHTDFQKAVIDLSTYQLTASGLPNASRVGGTHLSAVLAQGLNK